MTIRRRRTAAESRKLILETAAQRLREHGLEGLNITGVAEQAGISHATLIHHFGSSGGMRAALADQMTVQLIQDLVAALQDNVSPEALIDNVFQALAEGGHAKLIAWRTVENHVESQDDEAILAGFDDLLREARKVMNDQDEAQVKHMILLVAFAAIGYGLAGQVMSQALAMSEDEFARFPNWLTEHLSPTSEPDE